jgi:hypothetical protein
MTEQIQTATGFPVWTRIVLVALAVAALIALSFVLGRATMGHSGHALNDVRPAVVHPVVAPGDRAPVVCHIRGAC